MNNVATIATKFPCRASSQTLLHASRTHAHARWVPSRSSGILGLHQAFSLPYLTNSTSRFPARHFSSLFSLQARKRSSTPPATSTPKRADEQSESRSEPTHRATSIENFQPSGSESLQLTWRDYDPEGGLPLSLGDLSARELHDIFGKDVDIEAGNWVLRLMNYRRQSGSLIDQGIEFSQDTGITTDMAYKALLYLRQIDPQFNENEAGAAWADSQIAELQEDYVQRAEGVGIYQRTQEEIDRDTEQQQDQSVLQTMHKQAKARQQEKEAEEERVRQEQDEQALTEARAEGKEAEYLAEKQAREAQSQSSEIALQQPSQKAWLQPVERKPWVKYYEEQATIIKDNTIPQMSLLRRLGPSFLVALAVAGACYYLHENYTPPPRSARLFPDVPPALSTLAALIGINVVLAIANRMPPLWRVFNRYFVSAPAYPAPSSVLLAMFTHQSFGHLAFNCSILWVFGRYLHEDVGRGTFLAIYLSTGALAGFSSLAYNVFRQKWLTYTVGSSTAVYGVIASACLLRGSNEVKAFGYELPITGLVVLGGWTAMEIMLSRLPAVSRGVDLTGHFAGLGFGSLAALMIKKEAESGKGNMVRKDVDERNGGGDDDVGVVRK